MVLETFAVTGGTPNASRVGNVINVPDPTTVLIVPAASPASPMATASSGDTPRTLRGRSGRRRGGWRRRRRVVRGRCRSFIRCRRRGRRISRPVEAGSAGVGRTGRLCDGRLDRLVRLAHLGVGECSASGQLGR